MSDLNKPKDKVPALWVEKAALGELDEATRAKLEARIEPSELAAQQQALRESNVEILRQLPAARVIGAIDRRQRRRKQEEATRSWLPGAWTLAPVLSLVALVLVVRSEYASEEQPITPSTQLEATRSKGLEPHLVVYRKAGQSVERLSEGAKAKAGDVLQLAYVSAGDRFGVVLSIDGAGAVTMHLPASGPSATLAKPRETLLGESYQLDAAPAFERFFLVTSDRAFEPSVVEAAARVLATQRQQAQHLPLNLPSGLKQASFTVTKVQP